MKRLLVSTCLTAVAASGIFASAPANAQTEQGAPPATSEEESSQAGLEAIVVTAQRKAENLQEVPISVAALPPERLENLNLEDLQDIQFATPNMTFAKGINYSLVNIRGIGSFNTNPGLEPAVATYIDGAYLERAFGAVYDIVDPASIQVLRGAQGTLWGRNATGGAVLITTADPEFDFGASASVEVGSKDYRKAEGVINVPLSDTIAVRLAARYRNEGGYLDNPTTGTKMGWSKASTIRGKIAFRPSDTFDIVLQYQRDRSEAGIEQNTSVLPAVYCLFCQSSAYTFPLNDPFTTVINNVNGGEGSDNTSNFYNLRANYETGDLTFTSVTAYRKTTNFAAGDFDFTEISAFNLFQTSGSKAFTHSTSVTSDFDGMFNFTAGVDYLHDKSTYQLFVSSTDTYSPPPAADYDIKTESISGFAEVQIKPTDRITVTAGGRYTHDKRTSSSGNQSLDASFNSFTPRLVLAYNADQANFYASYNRGFKAGGFSGGPLPENVFLPEKIDSYEVGAKFFSSDRSLRANIAAFLYKYKDVQLVVVDQSNVGNITTASNAGAATGKGVELDLEYEPTDWLNIFGGVAYLDAKYDRFENASVDVPTFDANGEPTGFAPGTEDLSGFRMPRAPRWTGSIGATVTAPLWEEWKGQITAAARFTSGFDFTSGAGGPLRAARQEGYGVVQLTGKLFQEDGNYEVNFFVNNLTNKAYDNYRLSVAPFGVYRVAAPSRTYGVGVTAKF